MASSTFTQNYKLSQFQPEDVPGWLSDYNADMLKIDEAIHTVSQVAEPVAKDLEALTARVQREEAQSSLQAEQIVSLQTGFNRVEENDNKQSKQIVELNGRVNSAEDRIAALEDGAPGTATEIADIKADIATIDTRLAGHDTSIAGLQETVEEAKQAADGAMTQMQDFNMIREVEFAPAAQVTGTAKLRSTWHNLQQVIIEGELHNLNGLTLIADVGYELASAEGKIFNTHWPEGSTEQANTTFNPIGVIYATGSALEMSTPRVLQLGWHYDVARNTTQLVIKPAGGELTDLTTDYATGPIWGYPMAIYD